MMILVIGTITLPEGGMEKLAPASAAMIAATRKEDGCIQYAFAQDILDPAIMHISEAWRDLDALTAHSQTDHMNEWRAAVEKTGIIHRDLKRYDTDEGVSI